MRNWNAGSGAQRVVDVGLVYNEVLSNASGTIEVRPYSPVRVRAVAAGTITVDGVLAMTLAADEIVTINVGRGTQSDTKHTVSVVFSAAVYAQVGQEVEQV